MADTTTNPRKQTLDKDLDKLVHVEEAASLLARGLVAPGLALLFLALATVFASVYVIGEPRAIIIIAAAAIGAYMALNIGANDVANNVGPAVGSRAMTLGGALVIAAVFESAGALIAGGDVVNTVSKGIVAPEAVASPSIFIGVMMAALISSALWINLATWIGAPVSTTHSVVGGVMGAGIAAAGFSAVDWTVMAQIAASWVVSPVMGGVVAALFLAVIKTFIIYQDDKITAARRWLPLLIAVMAGAFAAYLATKGLKKIVHVSALGVTALGLGTFVLIWVLSHFHVRRQSEGMENRNQSLRKLFNLPLVISAALLSFAHGANDVANAVGPLAAIVFTAQADTVTAEVAIPIWVMIIGALGISIGLVLYGPKLIRMVGEQITKLNPMRAFCVALAAAITVIIASWLGLPVSSTHTAVGAVFGVGFFREWYTARSKRRRAYLERKGLQVKNGGSDGNNNTTGPSGGESGDVGMSREEIARRKLVRRAHVRTIVAAWVTTVPAAGILAAGVFLLFDAVL
ncbi:inorganic phosphate transporter [Chelativorans sp. M5D2P16]|uniref:inorganic phosphate transporter n=1 Tax=Chelativorans sp. M5D2P16 TaxID=3095678 RepID=UPI002ACA7C12|nr:inorganic phosphate transporter [Chelativorans sp. M5D2P16]MDZ5696814.1 inorganic phosphate transporter [Chelativorans sp. M5D2P16]